MNDSVNDGGNCWEQVIEDFENESPVRHSKPFEDGLGDFEAYLEQVDARDRERLLLELSAIDLELRIKKGEQCRAEDFLQRFSNLKQDRNNTVELLKTEIQTRSQFESLLSVTEYQNRFPQFADEVAKMIPVSSSDELNPRRRFRKQKLYRQGGLGNVWEGIDEEFGRRVAIKEVKGKFADDKRYERRFEREANLTALLEHPGIVPVHGKGVLGNGHPFYAMRFVEGNSLASQILKTHKAIQQDPGRQRIEMQRLLRQFIDVCDAIAFAHSQGILHLDMKPANIMVGEYGETLVVDWGLARRLDKDSDGDSVLDVDEGCLIAGSPAYMSPEQHAGDASRICFATDVYGLGATLLTILTGNQNPNEAISGDKETQVSGVEDSQTAVPRSMRPLFSVCAKAMQPAIAKRYQTVADLKHDVERFLALDRVVAHSDTMSDRWLRFQLRNPALFAIFAAFALLVAMVSTGAAVWVKHERDAALTAKAEAEMALENEAFANRQASSKSLQLRGVVELVSNMFSNPASCGLKADATLVEGVGYLVASTEKHPIVKTMPVVQGTLLALKAKFLKGQKEYSQAVEWYQNAIDKMTNAPLDSGGLENDDPYVLEFQVGRAAALHKARDYQPAYRIITDVLAQLSDDPVADQTRFGALTVKSVIEGDQRMMKQALKSIDESIELGETIYSKDDIHLLQAMKTRAQLLMATNKNRAAMDQFLEVQSGYERNSLVTESARMSVDMSIALLCVRMKQPGKAKQILLEIKEKAKQQYGESSDEYQQIVKKIEPVLLRIKSESAKSEASKE